METPLVPAGTRGVRNPASVDTPLVPTSPAAKPTKFSSMHDLLEGANNRSFFEATPCAFELAKKTVTCVQLSLVFVFIVAAGGLLFTLLEHDTELARIDATAQQYARDKDAVMQLLSHNATLYGELQNLANGLAPGPQNIDDNWGAVNAMVFAFTVVTTIGYGNIAPATTAGQLYLVVFALLGIPAAGVCLAYIADRLLYLITRLSQVGTNKLQAAFELFDSDGSGELDPDEFKSALKELGFDLPDHQFREVMKRLDTDGNGLIDQDEFAFTVKHLHADLTESAGRSKRVRIVLLMILIWVAAGTVGFAYVEDWDLSQTFYFIFVSLTTVGLGDFFPRTLLGKALLVAFAMLGLGLVAMLLTLLEGVMRAIEQAREHRLEVAKEASSVNFLRKVSAFDQLPQDYLESLASMMSTHAVAAGTDVFKEGDASEDMYVLVHGELDVVVAAGAGNSWNDSTGKRERVVETIHAPAFFGEEGLTGEKRHATVRAKKETCCGTHHHVRVMVLARADWDMLETMGNTADQATVHAMHRVADRMAATHHW